MNPPGTDDAIPDEGASAGPAAAHSLGQQRHLSPWAELLPGLAVCLAGCLAALGVHRLLPAVSPLLAGIVLGIVVANVIAIPPALRPGIAVVAKRVLRLGIILLGLQLSLSDILGLGGAMVAVVVAVVGVGMGATIVAGRLLKMSATQTVLIACGFSICGAAAVAAADGVVEAEDEEVATAVALVVLFGTLMIPVVGVVVPALGLDPEQGGLWAGASIHEVAQVVAAAGTLGSAALAAAVVVKLSRVLMLAPVMAILGWQRRRTSVAAGGSRPPLIPLFVVGFILAVLLATTGWLSAPVETGAANLEVALLAAAMFALGCGVRVKSLIRVGPKPLLLGVISTVVVATIAMGGVLLATG